MSTPERRGSPRGPFFAIVTVTAESGGEAIEAHAYDISRGGVGLVGAGAPEVGRAVRLRFHFTEAFGPDAVEEVTGLVAYTLSDENAACFGVEFLEPLEEAATPRLVRQVGEG